MLLIKFDWIGIGVSCCEYLLINSMKRDCNTGMLNAHNVGRCSFRRLQCTLQLNFVGIVITVSVRTNRSAIQRRLTWEYAARTTQNGPAPTKRRRISLVGNRASFEVNDNLYWLQFGKSGSMISHAKQKEIKSKHTNPLFLEHAKVL